MWSSVRLFRAAGRVFRLRRRAASRRQSSLARVTAGVAAPGLVVFLEQRGAGGGQADLILRGGTFEQALVLLNGFRITTARPRITISTLPIPLDAMDRIQVLHGAGSTLHGEDALSGVVDFLTAAPSASSLRLRAERQLWRERRVFTGRSCAQAMEQPIDRRAQLLDWIYADRDYRNMDASSEKLD